MTRNAHVLVVEDNDESAQDFVRALEQADYRVTRAAASSDASAAAVPGPDAPDVVLLDLQIPSEPGRADENVEHGFSLLDELLDRDPFRPVVIVTAHSHDRKLTRRALQRTHGGQFVFKDVDDLERVLLDAVAVALASPAYRMSRAVHEFRDLVEQDLNEDRYRSFIDEHWRALLGPEYRECKSPYTIARGAEVDILAVRHDGFPDLWELKKPGAPLFKDYNQWKYHSPDCAKALGQLIEYLDLAEKERTLPRGYDARRDVQMFLHRPRGFVVIGRYGSDEERDRLRLENRYLSGVAILTYDDLIERAEQFLWFLQRHRNGSAS